MKNLKLKRKIVKHGNSLGITIPKVILDSMGKSYSDTVEIEIVLKSVPKVKEGV